MYVDILSQLLSDKRSPSDWTFEVRGACDRTGGNHWLPNQRSTRVGTVMLA